MDIQALSMSMAQSSLLTSFGFGMMDKALETQQANTEALTKMMELSVNPDLGANIDLSV
ncbi:MAG: YjfB family protein [Lachnospiraceae bacterium]|nr:YjfB family protein [Candidatus Merdinaster equi]